jgi:hypothetical protein
MTEEEQRAHIQACAKAFAEEWERVHRRPFALQDPVVVEDIRLIFERSKKPESKKRKRDK